MKIGIVTTWFERGAAYVSRQYRNVLKEEHEVFIYVRGGEGIALKDESWNVPNLTIGKGSRYSTRTKINLSDFRSWILKNKIDLVLFNEQQEWAPLKLCRDLDVISGAYIDYYKKETVEYFSAYDFLFCNTKRHYSVFKEHPQCFYIPWGTDIDFFKPLKSGYTSKGCLTLFHSAGMNPSRKGTDYIIKAIEAIKDERLKTIIHTQVELEHFFPELSGSIRSLIKGGRLEVINKTVPAPGLYYLADIYVYPTRLEGIGLSIAEASACGLPVITTNSPPMNEFIQDNVNGKLIEVEEFKMRADNYYWPQALIDLEDLKEKINWYLLNYDQVPEMKATSREVAVSTLNWGKNASKLSASIKDIQKINTSNKMEAIESALAYDKKRPLKYYLHTFLPYVKLKRRVKKVLKSKWI